MIEKAYFIIGARYLRYDAASDAVDPGYPKQIAGTWNGFQEIGYDSGIEAVATWPNGKAFFFKGDQYARYDIASNRMDIGYPQPIAGNWPGFSEAVFADGINAAIDWGNGKAYFFRAGRYVRYDIAADRVDDGYPLAIASGWPTLAQAGFENGIKAAVNWGNGKAYFFRGDQYVRYDIAADRVDDGFPLPIAEGWPALAQAGFAVGISAAWTRGAGTQPAATFGYLTDEFFVALRDVCNRLNCATQDLLGVMESESGVGPSRQNPNGKATGLIQFMPDTLRRLGWTQGPDAFAQLSAEQQLPFVERFFSPNVRLGLGSAGRLYQSCFMPATLPGSDESTVLCGRTGPHTDIYQQNATLDINRDGVITVSDLTARVEQVRRGARWSELMRRMSVI